MCFPHQTIQPLCDNQEKKRSQGITLAYSLCTLELWVGLPFSNSEAQDDSRHPVIHLIQAPWKSSLQSLYKKELPRDRIICFFEINFENKTFFFLLLASSTTSFATNTQRKSCLPSKKTFLSESDLYWNALKNKLLKI